MTPMRQPLLVPPAADAVSDAPASVPPSHRYNLRSRVSADAGVVDSGTQEQHSNGDNVHANTTTASDICPSLGNIALTERAMHIRFGGTMDPLYTESEPEFEALATRVRTKVIQNPDGTKETRRVPRNHREAKASSDYPQYLKAMEVEYNHHVRAHSWDLVIPPSGAYVIEHNWQFDLKLDFNQAIKRFKARLCAMGSNEARKGLEYFFSFSSTAGLDVFRLFFAYAAYKGWPVHEADYFTAYLNALIDAIVYMRAPSQRVDLVLVVRLHRTRN